METVKSSSAEHSMRDIIMAQIIIMVSAALTSLIDSKVSSISF